MEPNLKSLLPDYSALVPTRAVLPKTQSKTQIPLKVGVTPEDVKATNKYKAIVNPSLLSTTPVEGQGSTAPYSYTPLDESITPTDLDSQLTASIRSVTKAPTPQEKKALKENELATTIKGSGDFYGFLNEGLSQMGNAIDVFSETVTPGMPKSTLTGGNIKYESFSNAVISTLKNDFMFGLGGYSSTPSDEDIAIEEGKLAPRPVTRTGLSLGGNLATAEIVAPLISAITTSLPILKPIAQKAPHLFNIFVNGVAYASIEKAAKSALGQDYGVFDFLFSVAMNGLGDVAPILHGKNVLGNEARNLIPRDIGNILKIADDFSAKNPTATLKDVYANIKDLTVSGGKKVDDLWIDWNIMKLSDTMPEMTPGRLGSFANMKANVGGGAKIRTEVGKNYIAQTTGKEPTDGAARMFTDIIGKFDDVASSTKVEPTTSTDVENLDVATTVKEVTAPTPSENIEAAKQKFIDYVKNPETPNDAKSLYKTYDSIRREFKLPEVERNLNVSGEGVKLVKENPTALKEINKTEDVGDLFDYLESLKNPSDLPTWGRTSADRLLMEFENGLPAGDVVPRLSELANKSGMEFDVNKAIDPVTGKVDADYIRAKLDQTIPITKKIDRVGKVIKAKIGEIELMSKGVTTGKVTTEAIGAKIKEANTELKTQTEKLKSDYKEAVAGIAELHKADVATIATKTEALNKAHTAELAAVNEKYQTKITQMKDSAGFLEVGKKVGRQAVKEFFDTQSTKLTSTESRLLKQEALKNVERVKSVSELKKVLSDLGAKYHNSERTALMDSINNKYTLIKNKRGITQENLDSFLELFKEIDGVPANGRLKIINEKMGEILKEGSITEVTRRATRRLEAIDNYKKVLTDVEKGTEVRDIGRIIGEYGNNAIKIEQIFGNREGAGYKVFRTNWSNANHSFDVEKGSATKLTESLISRAKKEGVNPDEIVAYNSYLRNGGDYVTNAKNFVFDSKGKLVDIKQIGKEIYTVKDGEQVLADGYRKGTVEDLNRIVDNIQGNSKIEAIAKDLRTYYGKFFPELKDVHFEQTGRLLGYSENYSPNHYINSNDGRISDYDDIGDIMKNNQIDATTTHTANGPGKEYNVEWNMGRQVQHYLDTTVYYSKFKKLSMEMQRMRNLLASGLTTKDADLLAKNNSTFGREEDFGDTEGLGYKLIQKNDVEFGTYQALNKVIDIVNKKNSKSTGNSIVDKIFTQWIPEYTVYKGIGGRLSTVLLQPMDMFRAAFHEDVGIINMIEGVRSKNKNASDFTIARFNTESPRDLETDGFAKNFKLITEKLLIPIELAEKPIVRTIWQGAARNYMRKSGDLKWNESLPDELPQGAIEFANDVTERIMNSRNASYKSTMEQESKYYSSFLTLQKTVVNAYVNTIYSIAGRNATKSTAARSLAGIVAMGVAENTMREVVNYLWESVGAKDKDNENLINKIVSNSFRDDPDAWTNEFKKQGVGLIKNIPIVNILVGQGRTGFNVVDSLKDIQSAIQYTPYIGADKKSTDFSMALLQSSKFFVPGDLTRIIDAKLKTAKENFALKGDYFPEVEPTEGERKIYREKVSQQANISKDGAKLKEVEDNFVSQLKDKENPIPFIRDYLIQSKDYNNEQKQSRAYSLLKEVAKEKSTDYAYSFAAGFSPEIYVKTMVVNDLKEYGAKGNQVTIDRLKGFVQKGLMTSAKATQIMVEAKREGLVQ